MRALLAALIFVAASCATLNPPMDGSDAVPLDPVPEVYRNWYASLEECAGESRPFDEIRFYRIVRNQSGNEAWFGPPNRILIDAGNLYRRKVVKHEMLHYLRQSYGRKAHAGDTAFTTCV